MKLIRPFRALRPGAQTAAAVIAPPYDVVSTAEARALAQGRPHSFLHVSRPEIDLPEGADAHSEAAYRKAAENLRALEDRQILQRDTEPSLYIYRMTDGEHSQTGVAMTASVAAYDENRVRRHELTRPDKENDRVRHMEAINAQTGPVLCAYRADPEIDAAIETAAAADPDISTVGPNDVLHTIWRVSDAGTLARLGDALNALEAIYIADGHHRSAAASRVAAARRSTVTDTDSHEYFLTVAFAHDQMRIYDYNRVVADLNGLSAADFRSRVGEKFTVERASAAVKPARSGQFGMYLDGIWYRLEARGQPAPDDPVAALDVSRLHDGLIEPLLGIANPRTDPRVDFVGGIRGLAELEARVDGGAASVAFSLFPTRMDQLMAVADAGRLMPPKSTWFEPKLADGLLSHVLD
jgi:uncharacterized protein (DUF1015 family)